MDVQTCVTKPYIYGAYHINIIACSGAKEYKWKKDIPLCDSKDTLVP